MISSAAQSLRCDQSYQGVRSINTHALVVEFFIGNLKRGPDPRSTAWKEFNNVTRRPRLFPAFTIS